MIIAISRHMEGQTGKRGFAWTKAGPDGVSAACLDRIYVSSRHNNRLVKTQLSPAVFSDHYMVYCHMNISPGRMQSSYWKFNMRLLQDAHFCSSLKKCWGCVEREEGWIERKDGFDSLRLWWVVGKCQSRHFCHLYKASATIEVRRAIKRIDGSIQEGNQAEIRSDLGSCLQDRAKGALVRARFSMSKRNGCTYLLFLWAREATRGRRAHALFALFCICLKGGLLLN